MSQPRIRSIKPETWQDEKIGRLCRDARLLFIGLITMADDEGRLRAIPSLVLGHVFPYDNVAPAKLDRWLAEVETAGLCRRYAVDGVPYLVLTGWAKHQKINRPSPSKLPPPPHGTFTEESVNGHGGVTDGSQPRVRARAGRSDRIGSGTEPPSPPASRGSSSKRAGSRANGTNPRALAVIAAADQIAPLGDQAASAAELVAALRANVSDTLRELWLTTLEPVGVDPTGAIVLSADARRLAYVTSTLGPKVLPALAERAGVQARFATADEADGLEKREMQAA